MTLDPIIKLTQRLLATAKKHPKKSRARYTALWQDIEYFQRTQDIVISNLLKQKLTKIYNQKSISMEDYLCELNQ